MLDRTATVAAERGKDDVFASYFDW